MHKTSREIRGKNCKTENANIWNLIGKEKNSEIQIEKFSQPAFCVTFWLSFVTFFRGKKLIQ